jgi:outer membrane lipopolysaccharide assembly protein LptE/RlpB
MSYKGKTYKPAITSWAFSLARPIAVCCLLYIILSGCGYHVAGKGGVMPGGVKKLAIPFFTNLTNRPNIETVITTAVIDEFIRTRIVAVVSKEESEAILLGSLTSYTLTPVSYNTADVINEYRLTIGLSLRLVRKSDNVIIWKDDAISDYEDFTVTTTNVSATKSTERNVLEKMAKDTARLIKERMMEAF